MKDCIGCGYCCRKSVCVLVQLKYDVTPDQSCPGLIWDGVRHWCEFVLNTLEKGDISVALELSIGKGCCSPLFNTWRKELKDRRFQEDNLTKWR